MSKTPNIAFAEIPDVEQYHEIAATAARLLSEVVGCEQPDYLLREMHDEDAHVVVAVTKQMKVVGASLLYLHGRSVLLDEIGVSSAHQRRGIGRGMVEAVESFAKDHDANIIGLVPVASHGFYERVGFTVDYDEEHAEKRLI